ncbi:hypothetical protein HU200_043323 [Digitaria exilis]|uniref:Transposase MuDR plant domain-containing protein n=1 Tax=Digitaria exilis TaxID=1010633 RepID=A0A835BBB3_9POAL|nr:hypothetical protein HU200_043323 [Digitaria exilis]
MDRLIRFFSGGIVKENGEFARMRQQISRFHRPPSFDNLVVQVNELFKVEREQWDICLRGRFDAGEKRAHYVLILIATEDDWMFYKDVVKGSQVNVAEIVVDFCTRGIGGHEVIQDDDPTEHLTQEHLTPQDALSEDDEEEDEDDENVGESDDEHDFERCRANNSFGDLSRENEGVDNDDISESSDEEDTTVDPQEVPFVQPQRTTMDPGASHEPLDIPVELDDGPMLEELAGVGRLSLSGVRLASLTPLELRQLKAVNVQVSEVPIFHSNPSKAYCDSGLRLNPLDPDSGEQFIEKGMRFDSLEDLKFFLRDYSMRHHSPYNVVHSNKEERYTVTCQQMCPWKVWARPIPDERGKWKITKVKQPHTCGSSVVSQDHSQCTARYIATRIASLTYADPDVSVATLIEAIYGFTNYKVKYGKAWRAKQHAIAMLWGDWKAAYARVPRILEAIPLE